MYPHERRALEQIAARLKAQFADRITGIYAFGSKVRGNHGAWSDLDVLVIVRDRDPRIEAEIVGIVVDGEVEAGLSFAPVIKDAAAFEMAKRFQSPFYENIVREGVPLGTSNPKTSGV